MDYEDSMVVEAMSSYGGGFVKCLAEAARHADPVNLYKLKKAFSNYWKEYGEFAKSDMKASIKVK